MSFKRLGKTKYRHRFRRCWRSQQRAQGAPSAVYHGRQACAEYTLFKPFQVHSAHANACNSGKLTGETCSRPYVSTHMLKTYRCFENQWCGSPTPKICIEHWWTPVNDGVTNLPKVTFKTMSVNQSTLVFHNQVMWRFVNCSKIEVVTQINHHDCIKVHEWGLLPFWRRKYPNFRAVKKSYNL